MSNLLESLSKDNSARRARRSVLPTDFDAEDEGAPLLGPISDDTPDFSWNDESPQGRESPEDSLLQPSLRINDDASAFSSVSPTSVAINLGQSSKRPVSLIPRLEDISLQQLIEKSQWKRLKKALSALRLHSFDDASILLSKRNSKGETPVHTLAWKAPTELVMTALDIPSIAAMLTVADRDNNTPLHLACANVSERSEFTVLKAMALLASDALSLQNDHGDTPLHLLVSSPAFIRSQDFIMEAEAAAIVMQFLGQSSHENLASQINNDEATMLHISLAVGAHERVILQVLQAAPEAARKPDHFGFLPIHYVAAFGGTPFPVVANLIDVHPESILAQTGNGDTPLHLLMSNANKFLKRDTKFLDRNTTKITELLLGDALMRDVGTPPLLIVNKSELNPLHVSACFESPPQLVRILLDSKHGPEATTATTSFGSTPLHLACSGKKSSKREIPGKSKSSKRLLASVETLASPASCAVRDSLGRTPLMVAVQNKKVNKKVVRVLLQVYPQAVEQRTSNGYLPLHLAVQSKHADASVVKTLIQEYPESVFQTNSKGDTPLHEACLCSKIPFDVVELLVSKNPSAVDCENSNHELPIDRARAMGASKKICSLLLETSKSLKEKEKENKKTKPEKSTPKENAKTMSSKASSDRVVSFLAPQLREPSINRRDAPDPPADSSSASKPSRPRSDRAADPTPVRERVGSFDAMERVHEKVAVPSAGVIAEARKTQSIKPPKSKRTSAPTKDIEGRTSVRQQDVAKRSISVSHVSIGRTSKRSDNLRSHTRSPPKSRKEDVHDFRRTSIPKPILERRAQSESNVQPRIARKKLSSMASLSSMKQNEVYRFEI